MTSIPMESVRSIYYMLTEESSSEFPFFILGMSILMIILLILGILYLPKYKRLTGEHLYCDTEVIPWSDIEHVRLKQSEWGNPYLAVYFKDGRSPASFDIERIPNAREFVDTIRERAAEKGFTFSTDHNVELKGEIQPEVKGMSEVRFYLMSWILFFAILIFMYAILFAFLEGKPFYGYFPLASLLLACFVLIFLGGEKLLSKEPDQTEKHLIIGKDVIPWSDIEHISLKKSEYGNPYLAIYFKDERSPKSYDTACFTNVEGFLSTLREKALEKGISFSKGPHVELDIQYPPSGPARVEEAGRQREEAQKAEEKREIKISPRQKSFLMILLAFTFFLGLYFIAGIRLTGSVFLVILVHECGHLLALRLFHMKVHGLFFIPFVGAGVLPKEEFPSPGTEAAVALAGPVAGLSLNLAAHLLNSPRVLTFFFNLHSSIDAAILSQIPSIILYIVLVNLLVNMLNLAPILPLDGGRIIRAALLRGRKSLIPVAVVTFGSGVVAGIYLKSIFFVVIAVIGLGSLVYNYKRIERREVEPPAWWKSALILGAWISVICLYWYTLPHFFKDLIGFIVESFFLE